MVEYTGKNLPWLAETYGLEPQDYPLEVGDATNHHWSPVPDFIACETYLGRPFTEKPSGEMIAQTSMECNLIIKKFLNNIGSQIPSGTRLCLAVPAWQIRPHEFKHLPLIDSLSDMGYNRMSFEHTRDSDLIYYRADQIVARQLLVITKR
jgi:tRNA G10  N-methylase Trm11